MSQINLGAVSTMRLPELREAAKTLGLEVDPKAKKADLVAAIRSVTGPARRGRPPKNRTEIKVRYEAPKIKADAAKSASGEANPLAGRVKAALAPAGANAAPAGANIASAGANAAKGGDAGASDEAKPVKEKVETNTPFEWPAARDAHNPSGNGDSSSDGGNPSGNGDSSSDGGSSDGAQDRSGAKTAGQDGFKPGNRSDDRGAQGADRAGQGSDRGAQGARVRRRGPREGEIDIVLPESKSSEDKSEHLSRRQRRERNERVARERAERNNERNGRGKNRDDRGRDGGMTESDKRAALDAIGDAAERRAGGEETAADRRSRNRNRNRNRDRSEFQEATQRDDEELLQVAGILDFDGNNAFLRTGGYLPGGNDAAVSQQIVKQHGLRRGDAIVGAVRPRTEGDQHYNNRNRNRNRNHYNQLNQLVQIDTINSLDVERSLTRPEFNKLTPLYPQDMLRLETTPKAMTPRAIDLVAPIGKGQRGLIVAPPKAGKTMVMQQIAMAIASNNPRVHLMVVLVDERPEEVTDMKRLVKGEVIASTFDRPASDHTIVAELAIERAKRLVELGQDVVVLLDSLTRLSRAYNLAAPASGRILSGGVDAAALYPPKKFFGAARNIENGGSLTIIASALVETGSKMDEVIFEEFKGTGNMELRLSRQLADRRIFPAIDVNASGTRREELLFSQEELKVIWQLRRALGTLDVAEASDFMLGRLRKTESNAEFLVQIMKSMQAN